MVSVVKLSFILLFNSLLSAIWVFLLFVICNCKSATSTPSLLLKLVIWVCNDVSLAVVDAVRALIALFKFATSVFSLLIWAVKLELILFIEVVLLLILILALVNPDCKVEIFDLLTL